MRSNCLIWALRQWGRRGGYLMARRSRWGPFPHFLWSPTAPAECEAFVPLNPRRKLLPKLWFRGYVKRGDA